MPLGIGKIGVSLCGGRRCGEPGGRGYHYEPAAACRTASKPRHARRQIVAAEPRGRIQRVLHGHVRRLPNHIRQRRKIGPGAVPPKTIQGWVIGLYNASAGSKAFATEGSVDLFRWAQWPAYPHRSRRALTSMALAWHLSEPQSRETLRSSRGKSGEAGLAGRPPPCVSRSVRLALREVLDDQRATATDRRHAGLAAAHHRAGCHRRCSRADQSGTRCCWCSRS